MLLLSLTATPISKLRLSEILSAHLSSMAEGYTEEASLGGTGFVCGFSRELSLEAAPDPRPENAGELKIQQPVS